MTGKGKLRLFLLFQKEWHEVLKDLGGFRAGNFPSHSWSLRMASVSHGGDTTAPSSYEQIEKSGLETAADDYSDGSSDMDAGLTIKEASQIL
jgi:hypothetical protein